MATQPHTIRLDPASYELLEAEAKRRGVSPEEVARELMRKQLAAGSDDAERMASALAAAAAVRAAMPPVNGVTLARLSRDELERRGTTPE